MLTGGIKTKAQAQEVVASGVVDVVGLARALVIEPSLPNHWMADQTPEPEFPRFEHAPEGGITAWYTMRLTKIATDSETEHVGDLEQALNQYEARDKSRTEVWLRHFSGDGASKG